MWRNPFSSNVKQSGLIRIAVWGPEGWCQLPAEIAGAGLDAYSWDAPLGGPRVAASSVGLRALQHGPDPLPFSHSLPVGLGSCQPLGPSGGLHLCSPSRASCLECCPCHGWLQVVTDSKPCGMGLEIGKGKGKKEVSFLLRSGFNQYCRRRLEAKKQANAELL